MMVKVKSRVDNETPLVTRGKAGRKEVAVQLMKRVRSLQAMHALTSVVVPCMRLCRSVLMKLMIQLLMELQDDGG
jgi:hypothetical protein